jgi:20S proteasome subunit beta 6
LLLAASGCHSDFLQLKKLLKYEVKDYTDRSNSNVKVENAAHLLSSILYGKRSMPYYVSSVLGGIDEKGVCFTSLMLSLDLTFFLHYL